MYTQDNEKGLKELHTLRSNNVFFSYWAIEVPASQGDHYNELALSEKTLWDPVKEATLSLMFLLFHE